MSMIHYCSIGGSSIWQTQATAASVDDERERWKKAAAGRLIMSAGNNQLIRNEFMMDNSDTEYCQHKKLSFSATDTDMSTRTLGLGVKMQQQQLPPGEMLPKNEALGGYIFVCNNETMEEDLRLQLFGLPQKYKDSVRAITPGLPLFLYNYTSHQLHGVFRAVSFGGSNIDPAAWEDKKCKGESRFPAQVRIRIKKKCKPLEEESFRPILYHYDGPKFRLQLSVPEALALLDLFKEEDI